MVFQGVIDNFTVTAIITIITQFLLNKFLRTSTYRYNNKVFFIKKDSLAEGGSLT
jgi:hypothetical protein